MPPSLRQNRRPPPSVSVLPLDPETGLPTGHFPKTNGLPNGYGGWEEEEFELNRHTIHDALAPRPPVTDPSDADRNFV